MGASNNPIPPPVVRRLGRAPYQETVDAMRAFTARRTPSTPDEFWLVEHAPVYTLGLKRRHEAHPNSLYGIPLIQTDRGGDITYHGPGQCVIYALINLDRTGGGIRRLVTGIEQSVIDLLAGYGVFGERRAGAPGVYVQNRKIAALGLRVRNGCTYHGLSLNVDMDLSPFSRIHPCGYEGLETVSLRALGISQSVEAAGEALVALLLRTLEYNARPT